MKILVLFDIAEPLNPFGNSRSQPKRVFWSISQRLGHQVETLAVFDNVPAMRAKPAHRTAFNLTESFHLLPAPDPKDCFCARTKLSVLAYHRVRLPRFVISHQARPVRGLQRFKYPAFVKPVGKSPPTASPRRPYVRTAEEAMERVRYIHQKFECDVLIEEYIEGRESCT